MSKREKWREIQQARIDLCYAELLGIDFPPGAVRRVIEALRDISEHTDVNADECPHVARRALSTLNLPDGWKP